MGAITPPDIVPHATQSILGYIRDNGKEAQCCAFGLHHTIAFAIHCGKAG